MNRSDDIAELAAAFSAAQGAMFHADKDATNPAFKSKYATLASVIDAVRGPLRDNGLSFTQLPIETESGVAVETVLLHKSGQWISSVTSVPAGKGTAHGIGAAYTYAKRYGLAAMCGISAETDDDGNVASKSSERRPQGVARTVVEESKASVDESRVLDIVIALRDSLATDDEHGVREVWSETDNDTKTVVWTRLDSRERARIKDVTRRAE
jgi:hypothetical protein